MTNYPTTLPGAEVITEQTRALLAPIFGRRGGLAPAVTPSCPSKPAPAARALVVA